MIEGSSTDERLHSAGELTENTAVRSQIAARGQAFVGIGIGNSPSAAIRGRCHGGLREGGWLAYGHWLMRVSHDALRASVRTRLQMMVIWEISEFVVRASRPHIFDGGGIVQARHLHHNHTADLFVGAGFTPALDPRTLDVGSLP